MASCHQFVASICFYANSHKQLNTKRKTLILGDILKQEDTIDTGDENIPDSSDESSIPPSRNHSLSSSGISSTKTCVTPTKESQIY